MAYPKFASLNIAISFNKKAELWKILLYLYILFGLNSYLRVKLFFSANVEQ